MDLLIHFLGEVIARRIEKGSLPGALIGALAGALIGVALGWTAFTYDVLHEGFMVVFAILGGVSGALLGSYVFSLRTNSSSLSPLSCNEPAVLVHGSVRITNFNNALGPLVIALILLCATVGLAYAVIFERRSQPLAATLLFSGLSPVLLVLATLCGRAFLRSVLWLDLGSPIHIRLPLHSRTYEPTAVRDWGFYVPQEEQDQPAGPFKEAPTQNSLFALVFSDGFRLEIPVPRSRVHQVFAKLREWQLVNPAPVN